MKLNRLFIFILVIILLALLSIYYPKITGNVINNPNIGYERESAFVTRVIDGDTLEVRLGSIIQTARLLGINTTMLEFIGR